MLEIINAQLRPNGEAFDHRFFDGGINVILGSNDSGKTNLCRFLTGLSSTASGEVLIDGESYSKISKRRPVSLVVQDFVNYPLWTVEENINSPLRAQGDLKKKQISARTYELGELLGLTDYLKKYPAELSGGQQQRVALGRALAKNARIMILDEPFVNLDFRLRESLRTELKSLASNLDTTIIYSTMDPKEALAIADDVLLIHDYSFIQCGIPLEVYSRPVSILAADLMSDPRVNVFRSQKTLIEPSQILAVRPEHLRPAESLNKSASLIFELKIEHFENVGGETFVQGMADGSEWVMKTDEKIPLKIGNSIEVGVPRTEILKFGSQ